MGTEGFLLGVQIIAAGIQGCATIGILLTFIVYFFQLRTMRQQLEASDSAAKGQNFIALMNFLQDEEVRDARRFVITKLSSKPLSDWTEEDGQIAARVCSTYDMAGLLAREGLIPQAPLVNSWKSGIEKCYEVLTPYIIVMQKKNGPSYWAGFDWLYEQCSGVELLINNDAPNER